MTSATIRHIRGVTFGAAVLAAVLAASACGGSADSSPNSSSKPTGTISIMTATDVDTPLKPIIAAFEKAYPGTTVTTQSFPASTVNTTIRARVNAGTPPDIIQDRPGYGNVATVKVLAGAAALTDLSDQPWASAMPTQVRALDSLNGKVYGYSPELAFYGMIYDKAAWQSLGLQVPTTFSQLLSLCGQITAGGKVPIAFGTADTGMIPRLAIPLAAGQVFAKTPDWNQLRAENKVTFAGTSGWTAVIDMITQMSKSKCFGPSPSGYTEQEARQNMATGKAVMTLANFPALLAINPKGQYGQFTIPTAASASGNTLPVAVSLSFVIPKKAKNPALAKAFLAFFARQQNTISYDQARRSVPTSLLTSKSLSLLPAGDAPLGSYITQGKTTTDPSQGWPPAEVLVQLTEGIQGMLSGQNVSAEQILQNMDTAWNQSS